MPEERRIPPYDEAAEKGLLGAVLLDGERVLPLVIQRGFIGETFNVPAHRTIFESMEQIFRSGTAIDGLILSSHMRNMGTLDQCGGSIYLDRLLDACPTAAHSEHYCDLIESKWMQRRIITAARRAETLAYDPQTEDADELIAQAQSGFLEIQSGRKSGDKHAVWERVEHNIEGAMRGEVVGLPSPWPSFDSQTGGPRRGMVTVLASKKGYGKSSLCATWMHYLATRDEPIPVLGMPFEDGEDLTWLRLAGMDSRVSSFMATVGRLDDGQYATIRNAGRRLIETPLHLIGKRGMTVDAIKAAAIQYKLRHDIGALFVDGFKDIRREWKDTNSEDARISAGLCDLAEMLNIPVIVVHHVIKSGGKGSDKEGKKIIVDIDVEDIRGNFRIIDDARMVCILQPQLVNDATNEEIKPYRLQCVRNNYVPTGTVDLEFERSINHFFERPAVDLSHQEEVPAWAEGMAD